MGWTDSRRALLPMAGLLAPLLLVATLGGARSPTPGSHQAEAGNADAILTVNSTANTDDGACGGAPNTTNPSGNCTFREGINAVNAGLATKLNFHPPVFSVATPGVIQIDNGDFPNNAAGNCLPAIERDGVTIDNTSTGVVIDGDSSLDSLSPIICEGVLSVHPPFDGLDFTLIGDEHFVLRQFNGHGISIDCNVLGGPFTPGGITITGVLFQDLAGQDVSVNCITPTPTATPTPLSLNDCHLLFASRYFEEDEFCGVVTEIRRMTEIPGTGIFQTITALPGADFAVVSMTVWNFSSAPDDVTDSSFRLRDSLSRIFTADFSESVTAQLTAQAHFGLPGVSDTLQPGLIQEMVFVFLTPTSAAGLAVERCSPLGCSFTAAPSATPIVTVTPTATGTAGPTKAPVATTEPTETPTTPTRTPTPTHTPTPTRTPERVYGDASCDGIATAVDATLMLQLTAGLIGSLPCPGNADVNRDGRADAIDSLLTLQFVAGLLDGLPAGASHAGAASAAAFRLW